MNRRSPYRNTGGGALIDRTPLKVRFSEVDALHVVWHGEYVRYFEDGRESFGKRYAGIGYNDIYATGYKTPIVDMACQYKLPLTFGEEAIVETRYIPCRAAKIIFEYTIYKADGKTVVATGHTIQVFMNAQGGLELFSPGFYTAWKQKWNVE